MSLLSTISKGRKVLILVGVVSTFLALGVYSLGSIFVTEFRLNKHRLRNAEDLCLVLGRNPGDDPLCKENNQLFLLREVFPVGETTRMQVRSTLGEYHLWTSAGGPAGITDAYIVKENFFLGPYQWSQFKFDHNGLLKYIGVYD